MDCSAFCTAKSYSVKPLYEALRVNHNATLHKDVIFAEIQKYGNKCQAFFFSYGVVVIWGLNKQEAFRMIETEINHFENTHLTDMETDEFTYQYIVNHSENAKILDDDIHLPNDEILTKLAISHGIAQS
nr:RMD1 family protein [Parachlamydiaceae bacterium]